MESTTHTIGDSPYAVTRKVEYVPKEALCLVKDDALHEYDKGTKHRLQYDTLDNIKNEISEWKEDELRGQAKVIFEILVRLTGLRTMRIGDEDFHCSLGQQQGGLLSPQIFVLCLERILNRTFENMPEN